MMRRVEAHFEEYYAPLDVWTEVDAFRRARVEWRSFSAISQS